MQANRFKYKCSRGPSSKFQFSPPQAPCESGCAPEMAKPLRGAELGTRNPRSGSDFPDTLQPGSRESHSLRIRTEIADAMPAPQFRADARSLAPGRRAPGYFTRNSCTVEVRYVSPGRRTVLGKSA